MVLQRQRHARYRTRLGNLGLMLRWDTLVVLYQESCMFVGCIIQTFITTRNHHARLLEDQEGIQGESPVA